MTPAAIIHEYNKAQGHSGAHTTKPSKVGWTVIYNTIDNYQTARRRLSRVERPGEVHFLGRLRITPYKRAGEATAAPTVVAITAFDVPRNRARVIRWDERRHLWSNPAWMKYSDLVSYAHVGAAFPNRGLWRVWNHALDSLTMDIVVS
jgi:hypothetical protein